MPTIPPLNREFDPAKVGTSGFWSNNPLVSGYENNPIVSAMPQWLKDLQAQPQPQPNVPAVTSNVTVDTTPSNGLLATGPLNAYTAPAPAQPQAKGDSFSPAAALSMDLWDFKLPNYNGVSSTGAANWSDLLNFGG